MMFPPHVSLAPPHVTDLRRSAPLLLALACLCAAGAPAAAQDRDSIVFRPTTGQPVRQPPAQEPATQQPPTQQTPKEQVPADTPVAQQPSRTRPAVQIPSVQLPNVRLPPLRPRTVAVPSLSGRTVDEARRILTGAGLVLGVVNELPVDRPAGTVFLQRPAAGTQAQRGAPVAVTLARAPAPAQTPPAVRTATVPDVTGQSLATAVRRIEAAGLRVGSVEGASGSTARVRRQSAAAGQTVPLGTSVGLSMAAPPVVVATRPPVRPPTNPTQPTQPAQQPTQPPAQQPERTPPAPRVDSVAVPDVGRLTLADARTALQAAGLGADVDPSLADSASWTVASQLPVAGERVPSGSGVGLALAAPPAPIAATQPPVVQPPAATQRPVERAPAPPVEAPRRTIPWLWIVLAIVVAGAAAAVARRWMRARGTVAAAPVAVSTRVAGKAAPRVEVVGAPFTLDAPRLRMRARQGTPELSVAAAGPLFTNYGGEGD